MTLSIWTGRSILLLDGIGAAVTAVSVGLILPALETWIGLPTLTLRLLGGFATVLAAYSLSRHITGRTTPTALRRVASANFAYCALTAALVAWHARNVTAWGFAYFAGEILIVAALSRRELALARRLEGPRPATGTRRRRREARSGPARRRSDRAPRGAEIVH